MWIKLNCLFFALLLPLVQQVPLDLSGKAADLHVLVVDPFGYPIPEPTLQVEQTRDNRVVRRFPGQVRMHLEAGTYRVVVETPGFKRAVKTVRITDKPAFVVIGISVASHEARAVVPEVAGRIPDLDFRLKCNSVRLIPLFLDGPALDAPVLLNQYFAIDNVEPGKYMAVVFGDEGLCRTSELTIRGWRRLEVVVSASPRR